MIDPILISLQTAVVTTAITMVLGVAAARWRIHRRGWFVELLDGVLLFPLALPPTVVGLLLLMIFGRQSPIGEALAQIGVTIVFSWPATVIAATAVALPIMYQTAKGAFQQIDPELLDAARVFGYSERRILSEVMLPLAWPGLMAGLILTFVRAIGEFGATLMLAGNIPGRTQTIPIAIFFHVESGDMAGALILSLVIVAISAAALIVFSRLSPGR
ncbi:MAG: molybdate ABC transporter permease subunit [Terrimicrobiaceae bacterium]|nr:molybdate ABC transporter permease subunit [Terrimicrobiaceae bacterium]